MWSAAAAPTSTDDVDGVGALLERDPGALLVAEASGRIVGTVIAAWDGWRGSVYRIVVAPEHRRDGSRPAPVGRGREPASAGRGAPDARDRRGDRPAGPGVLGVLGLGAPGLPAPLHPEVDRDSAFSPSCSVPLRVCRRDRADHTRARKDTRGTSGATVLSPRAAEPYAGSVGRVVGDVERDVGPRTEVGAVVQVLAVLHQVGERGDEQGECGGSPGSPEGQSGQERRAPGPRQARQRRHRGACGAVSGDPGRDGDGVVRQAAQAVRQEADGRGQRRQRRARGGASTASSQTANDQRRDVERARGAPGCRRASGAADVP